MKLIEGQTYSITAKTGTFKRVYQGTEWCEFDGEPLAILLDPETGKEKGVAFSRILKIEEVIESIPVQEGWKLHIPASPTGKRRAYDFCHVGTLESAKLVLCKSLTKLAEKQGEWSPMTEQEIEGWVARAEADLDRF